MKVGGVAGIDDVLRGRTGAAGLVDAVAEQVEVVGGVGVGVDGEAAAFVEREPGVGVGQVQAFRLGVDLDRDAACGGRLGAPDRYRWARAG